MTQFILFVTFCFFFIGYAWLPAVCYFFQNTFQYTALENLPSSVYAVLQQLKIFSAAIFSIVFLGKAFAWRQWRALILLIAGAILIEYHTFETHSKGGLENADPLKGNFFFFLCL